MYPPRSKTTASMPAFVAFSATAAPTFAAASTAGGTIEFADTGGFVVGTITATGCFQATSGVTTTDGSVVLTTSAGSLSVQQAVEAGGLGDVSLVTTTAGDVILTGTPAGVGAVQPGDRIEGGVDGLPPISLHLTDPE